MGGESGRQSQKRTGEREMKIDRDTIAYLEALARIELGEEERVRLAEQMGRIVAFVERLQSVDTSGVVGDERVDNGVAGAERLREDISEPGLDRDDVLLQALRCFAIAREGIKKTIIVIRWVTFCWRARRLV